MTEEKPVQLSTLEEYKRWLYAADIHPSSGCTACGNCYGRGPANWLADEHNTADWKCVPFDFYGWRRYTPSAFWEIATKYYHGLMDIDEDVQETLFSCAQCGLCNEVCGEVQGNARLSDIFKQFRFIIYEKMGPFRGHANTISNIKRHGNSFGLNQDPNKRWSKELEVKSIGKNSTETALVVGEDAAFKLQNVAASAVRILNSAGVGYGVFDDEMDSGYYLETMGDKWGAVGAWEKFAAALKKNGIKNVICLSAPDYHVLRRELGTQYQISHITEFVSSLLSSGRIKVRGGGSNVKVVYHDPCYLARQAGSRSPRERRVLDEPRKILNAIPNLELLEFDKRGRWTWCAGECGGVKQAFPDMARWRAQKLIEDAKMKKADVIATATPNEQLHLKETIGSEVLECKDVMELLAENL